MKRVQMIALAGILVLCMLAGCKKSDGGTVSPTPMSGATLTKSGMNVTGIPFETTEFSIYTIDDSLTELRSVTVAVSAEDVITEQSICDAVIDALTDCKVYARMNSVNRDGDVVVVDFSKDAPPVVSVSAEVEGLILDAFCQSILDNVKECNGVTFTVNQEEYRTASLTIEKGEVYMKR